MLQICRLCLKSSSEILFDSATSADSKQIDLLLPEIDINIVDTPVICSNCKKLLNKACTFKTTCLKSEKYLVDIIHKYKTTKLEELLKADISRIKDEMINIKPDPVIFDDKPTFEKSVDTPYLEQFTDASNDGDDIADEDASSKANSLTCQFCGKKYGHIKALKRHLKSHIGTKPTCTLCDRTFYDTTGLKRHKLRYHGDSEKEQSEKLVCKPCNKNFYYLSAFRRHNRFCHLINEPPIIKKDLVDKTDKTVDNISNAMIQNDKQEIKPEFKYYCSVCNKGFTLGRVLNRHLKTHSNTIFDCDKCKKKFRLEKYLREHKQRVHRLTEKSLDCDECKVVFTSPEQITNHIRLHHADSIQQKRLKSFVCDVCFRRFFTLANFNRHKVEHEAPNIDFKCKFCQAQLTSKFYLNSHINQFHYDKRDDLKYICRFCDSEFSSKQDMLDHRKATHSSEEMQRYTCDTCGITCYGRANLKNHLLIHTGNKPFTCDICGVSFYQIGSLNVHKKATHSDEKPFACGYCDWRFALKGMLTKHLQSVHLKDMIEKKYKCTFCEKSFRIESTLKYHMRWHTDERTYNCDVCNKAFIDRSSVQKHRRIHFERTHICEVCRKGFHQKSNLKIHMRVHQK